MAGNSSEDLARTLVETGLLSPEQLRECREAAKEVVEGVTPIDIALRKGYLDKTQVDLARTRMESEQAQKAALRRDLGVAKFAIKQRFVTREQVETCRREQLRRRESGEEVDLLGVLRDEGCISEEQEQVMASAVGDTGYRRLGDFEIIRRLGEGGMGAVYKARQVSMDRVVALKVLPSWLASDETYVERFYREARACAKLDHPNVVRGLAVGEAEGHHYFAMEYVDGPSLKQVIEREGPLPPWRAVPIFAAVAKGLAHAHSRGLIHRDIKPDNIMLTRDGVPKLADLGLAKDIGSTRTGITESGTAMGTAYYMAPEQARDAKRADLRSDIYALGATLYHVLTGRVPYEGATFVEVTRRHEEGPLVPPRKLNPDIPERLSLIVEKMMSKKPEFRFKSASEVAQALDEIHLTPPRRPRRPTGELPRAEAAVTERKPPPQLWYVGLAGPGGKPIQEAFDLPTLQRHIESGRVPLDALVRQGKSGPFRSVYRYPQLARAVDLRRARLRDSLQRHEPYREIYREYDRRLARRRLIARIKTALRWLFMLAVLGAAVWAAVRYLLPSTGEPSSHHLKRTLASTPRSS